MVPYIQSTFRWCSLFFVAAWLTGCATTPQIDWNSRVGVYSYDQAVIDMGPPDKSARLSNGATVVEWKTSTGRYYSSPAPFGYYGVPYGAPYGGRYGTYPGYVMSPQYIDKSPDKFLRLVFDPTGMLASWTDFMM